MNIIGEIVLARNRGHVHCGISSQASPSISELAIEFGLANNPTKYREIDPTSALRLLELVLKHDMAYDAEIMTADLAAELANRFLAQFGTTGVRYYSNRQFQEVLGVKPSLSGISWNPVTNATFDTGILVIGLQRSGCLWVEDED